MTRDEFISAATEVHGDKYDYTYVSEQGLKYMTNVAIKCSKHGMFWENPYSHLHGLIRGCFECYKEKNLDDNKREL